MTSRERILKTCNFEEPDRVPIDIGGTQVSGVCVDEYCELIKYLGIDEIPIVYEQFEMLARISEPVRQRLHSDVISLENPIMSWGLRNTDWKLWTTFKLNNCYMPGDFNPVADEKGDLWLYDKNGKAISHMANGSLYFDYADSTAMSSSFTGIDPEEWRTQIHVYSDDELKEIEKNAKFLHENTEYAVVAEFAACKFGSMNRTIAGLSPTDWLCTLITDPSYIDEILCVCGEQALLNTKLFLEAVSDNVDVIILSTIDYGTQRAELFNPEIWRRLYLPRYKAVNDYVHSHTKHTKTFIHSCGSIRHLIGYIIEAGFDILNPVQVTADYMDAASLKEEFGHRIVFWGGGVDTQTTLPFGTTDEVEEQVKERIRILGKGGGFVFNPVHCIQYGVPVENLLRAADTAYTYGKYPLS